MTVKIALQEAMAPGSTFGEKLQFAQDVGFEGMEVSWLSVLERLPEMQASLERSQVPISTVCGSGRHDILCLDRSERESRLAEIRRLLDAAAALDAVGLIIVPIRTGASFPDLSPFMGARELMTRTAVSILQDLAGYAAERGVCLLLEPLIRYETPFLRRLDEAVAICEEVQSPGLAIMADFFHMHTEESDIPEAILAAGNWLRHVHLADSNRLAPGRGHTDFVAGFQALAAIDYQGYMALECGLAGDAQAELARALAFLRECREQARAKFDGEKLG